MKNVIISIKDTPAEEFFYRINLFETQIKELNDDAQRLKKSTQMYKEKVQKVLKNRV